MEKGKCRSCGADILWVRMGSGTPHPINAEPVPTGNVVILDGVCQFTEPDHTGDLWDQVAEGPRYQSHFATCPDRDKWKKRK